LYYLLFAGLQAAQLTFLSSFWHNVLYDKLLNIDFGIIFLFYQNLIQKFGSLM
jgi:hypothetical protein